MTVTVRSYRGGKGYEVDISVALPDGRRVRERKKAPVTSKSGARRWAEAREREILLRGLAPTPPKKAPLLSEFERRYIDDYCRANRQKASSTKSKESILRTWLIPHLGAKRLDEITTRDVQSLKAAMSHRSAKHANNVLTTLSTILKAAVEWGEIDDMPCKVALLPVASTERPFWDFDQYEWLVEAALAVDARTHLAVLLGGSAGLRVGEVIALEQSDVDHRRGFLQVQRAEWMGIVDTPKSGRGRRVRMTNRLAAALRAHRHLRGPRVLYRDDGTTVTSKLLSGWLKVAEQRAGLPARGNTHMLRHTFCSHLAMRGAPAKAIQELAGHANLSTTMSYMHLSPAALDTAISLLDAPIPSAQMEK